MDINDLRGVSTILAMAAFLGVVWWAYSATRKDRFEEDGNIPFADEDTPQGNDSENK